MDPNLKKQIKKYMELHASECSSMTELAETTAQALDHDEWLDDPDHEIWDLAMDYLDEDGNLIVSDDQDEDCDE